MASGELSEGAFLAISQLLTGHADLNPVTARRIAAAFAVVDPKLYAQFQDLVGVTAIPEPLTPVARAIVAAWYTGTVGTGTTAITVSYRDALMQRPVADMLTPPTYSRGGPGWWAV